MTDSFQRYLRAKRTVDDRALDRRVVETLRTELAARADTTDGPLRVLEIGAGIGTMVARAVEWDLLPPGRIEYTALDLNGDNVAAMREYFADWASDRPVTVSGTDTVELDCSDRQVVVEPVTSEAVTYAADTPQEFDLLVGAALLDILDLNGLDTLLESLAPGGLYYFPITFDGATRFRPSHPADETIEGYYHDHMDQKPGGSSRAGSDVLERLRAMPGVELLAVAGSDWIVRPDDSGYPGDEAYFLRHILDTVESAVGEMGGKAFDELGPWLAQRRAQVDAGELVYLTHQLDFLGRIENSE
ncbi:hypothetical protein Harman_11190 [Haloarcula mannanilytica]|uniref:Methyltransferase domain-containing protein n=1 Tax=Haloarcula mannanilytica TaxID=2509225 RepID=A0A4C2EFL1_9EURY|nr:hypothetical protein [Haloarcula mannanilytica]GCF13184.1 hypothetical protein Harman_11190 [Haloarcula mannanilytica]